LVTTIALAHWGYLKIVTATVVNFDADGWVAEAAV
jgi:hypothetical protein